MTKVCGIKQVPWFRPMFKQTKLCEGHIFVTILDLIRWISVFFIIPGSLSCDARHFICFNIHFGTFWQQAI